MGHFGDKGTPSWQLQGGIDGRKKGWKWEWGLEKLHEPVPLSDPVQEEGEPSTRHVGGMLRAFWGWHLLPSQTSTSAGAVLPPPTPPVDYSTALLAGAVSSGLVLSVQGAGARERAAAPRHGGRPTSSGGSGVWSFSRRCSTQRGFSLQLWPPGRLVLF